MTKDQKKEIEQLALPLMDYLEKTFPSPHIKLIISMDRIEFLEGFGNVDKKLGTFYFHND